jgi:hypothetical protein
LTGAPENVVSGSHLKLQHLAMRMRVLFAILICATVSGCGLAAAPCRVASAAIKIVPVIGHPAAAPTDACAAVIDP